MSTKIACFLDTNILLYAALGKSDAPEKFRISRALLASWNFGLSTQVLGEFFVNAVLKSKRPLSCTEAAAMVAVFMERPCVVIDQAIVRAAMAHAQRYQIKYWDAAIIAAAERLEAPVLYTEDLNNGQTYGSVRVENPFSQS
ncbi:PIN domain-containing protein [Rhodoplanes azumiensis]|uniref:PIN domain-containing protein n=1 Tax=Rhodoplanes azumiensis TaxID=1897628 RepID=A0ABW5AKM3_9BRAD